MNDSYLYQLVCVEPTSAPEGSTAPWHRYEIANRHARVTGRRPGPREDVRNYALECIARLNARVHEPIHPLGSARRSSKPPEGAEAG